ncbi:MAG: tRNA pseudouridine(38-40) synthase TruA [Actinomycetia bacterium]|nr:tRNA pseudouridine(38-40) synthase TruA [Actinomycetes bacterium]
MNDQQLIALDALRASLIDAEASDPTYALIVSYDGTNYAGYARQTDPPQRTIQDDLERALTTVLRVPTGSLLTTVAGRTDAGVHAFGQVVSFTPPAAQGAELFTPTGLAPFLRSLNALTPHDISVRALRAVPPGFSARFDALSREYRYRISVAPTPPLFARRYVWHLPGFGAGAARREQLRRAVAVLIGEHDFSSFAVAASIAGKNPVRQIFSIDVVDAEFFGEPLVEIRIVGTAFLHSMVRVIVGTLAAIDTGRIAADSMADILAARARGAAGQTAPASGLTFFGATYETFSSASS